VVLSGSTLVAGEVVYIRREAWAIVSDHGPVLGGRQYSISRGVLETQAVPHGTSSRDNVEVYRTLRVLEARRIELFRVDMDAAAYDEEVIWSGIIRSVDSGGPERLTISTDTALGLLGANKLMRNQWKGKVRRGSVFQGRGWLNFEPSARDPVRRNLTMDAVYDRYGPALVQVKGAGALIVDRVDRFRSGDFFVDKARGPYIGSRRFGLSPELSFQDMKEGAEVFEILSSNFLQPIDPLLDRDDASNLPLATNPAVLVLQILLSMPSEPLNAKYGWPLPRPQQNHPVYDTGIGNISAGIPASLVDVEAIEAWGLRRFGNINKDVPELGVDCFHLGIDGKTESVAAAIRRILHPFLAVLVTGRAGQLKIVDLADALSYGTTNVIVQDDILTPPTPTQDRRLEASA